MDKPDHDNDFGFLYPWNRWTPEPQFVSEIDGVAHWRKPWNRDCSEFEHVFHCGEIQVLVSSGDRLEIRSRRGEGYNWSLDEAKQARRTLDVAISFVEASNV